MFYPASMDGYGARFPHAASELRMTQPVHVWVTDCGDRAPGLLTIWRRTPLRGVEGWVVEARFVAAHEHLSVGQRWVPMGKVERA